MHPATVGEDLLVPVVHLLDYPAQHRRLALPGHAEELGLALVGKIQRRRDEAGVQRHAGKEPCQGRSEHVDRGESHLLGHGDDDAALEVPHHPPQQAPAACVDE